MRSKDSFFISGYLMPPRTDEAFLDLKNSHLNHIYLDFTLNDEIREKALFFCDKFDINAIIMTCWSRYDNPSFEKVVGGATKHPSFCGVNGLDEPIYEDFPSIFTEQESFSKKFKDKTFYVNMVNCNVPQKFIANDENIHYDKLINVYKELLNKIEFDKTASMTIYPLMVDTTTGNAVLHPKHLQSLDIISKVASDTGAEMYFFVQTMPFRDTHRKPSLEDLYFQVNTGLAFGAKGVQYFCYRTPDPNWEFNEKQYAMILKDGTKTDIYYSVKEVNEWLIKLAPYYLNLKHKITFGHKNNLSLKSDDTFEEFIKEERKSNINILFSSRDVVVGEFESENSTAFFITNYGEPSKQEKNSIEFILSNDAKSLKIISKDKIYNIEKTDGKFVISLDKGEGVLVLYA